MKAFDKRLFGLGMAAVMLASAGAVPASAVGVEREAVSVSASEQLGGLAKPKITASKRGSSAVKLKWNKVDKAAGYKVFVKIRGSWKCKAVVKGGSNVSAKVEGLDSKTKYQFKVQAFKKSKGKTYYSKYSAPVTVETTYGVGASNWTNKYMSVRYNNKKWIVDGNKDMVVFGFDKNSTSAYTTQLAASLMQEGDVYTTDELVKNVIEVYKDFGLEFVRVDNVTIAGRQFAKLTAHVEGESEDETSATLNMLIKASGRKVWSMFEMYTDDIEDEGRREIDKLYKTIELK